MRTRFAILAVLSVSALTATLLLLPQQAQPMVAQPKAEAGALPADLALVPNNALGFVHVKLAEVWKSDAMSNMRNLMLKAGPKAFATLDEDFTPKPSTIDRITLVLLPLKEKPEPTFVTILAFSEPYDASLIQKRYMPQGKKEKANGKDFISDKNSGISLYFADKQTMVFGDHETLPQYLALDLKADGRMKTAIAGAASRAMTACVNVKALPIPPDLAENLDEAYRPLLKTEHVLITADMAKEITMKAELVFANAEDAKASEKGLRQAAEVGRQQLVQQRGEAERLLQGKKNKDGVRPLEQLPEAIGGLAMLAGLNTADEFLTDLPLKVAGNSISMSFAVPQWATQYVGAAMLSAGLAIPAVQKVRNAAARMQSSNNLKQLGIAMHAYHDVNGTLPPAAICDKKGKRLLSWRVAILPYIEQNNLYNQFKMDEPWDSENNKKASSVMIKTYVDPRVPNTDGKTYYKLFVGKTTPFDWVVGKRLTSITDGTSNTIMIAAAGEPVEWAKPDDFEFDPEAKLPDLTKPFGNELLVAMCDGSVRVINTDIKDFDNIMKLLIQSSDGNVIPDF